MAFLARRVSCQELVELASGYLDGTLAAAVTRCATASATCPTCPTCPAQLRVTVERPASSARPMSPGELLDVRSRAWEDQHRDR